MRRLSHWNGKCPAQDQSIGKEETWANLKSLKSIFPFIPRWLLAGEVEKAEEPKIKLQISIGSSKKQEFQKNIYFCFIDSAKAFDWVVRTNCGKFLKRWEYQTTLAASWENCMQVKKEQWELDMEQQTGSKSGKGYVKAIYCYPVYLTCMQSTSYEMPGWMKHKLESRLPGEIPITSNMQTTQPLWQKVKRN